jgi:hypothetical protein
MLPKWNKTLIDCVFSSSTRRKRRRVLDTVVDKNSRWGCCVVLEMRNKHRGSLQLLSLYPLLISDRSQHPS